MKRSGRTMLPAMAAFLAIFAWGLGLSAQSLEVRAPFINEAGDLELEFKDDVFPRMEMTYQGRAMVDFTLVCVDFSGRALRSSRFRQNVRAVVDRSLPFTGDFEGRVFGLMTLYYPRDEGHLICPAETTEKLARVRYSEIEVRDARGNVAVGADVSRMFVRLH